MGEGASKRNREPQDYSFRPIRPGSFEPGSLAARAQHFVIRISDPTFCHRIHNISVRGRFPCVYA
jgi:hypothetical protein